MKTIKLQDKTHDRLLSIKYKKKYKSMDAIINDMELREKIKEAVE